MTTHWRPGLSLTAVSLIGLALTTSALVGPARASAPHMGHGMASPETAQLALLRGRAFDLAFVREMIVHHQMAVQMAGAQLRWGSDARVKAAATQVVAAQNREIKMMQGWLKAWNQPGTLKAGSAAKLAAPSTPAAVDRWFLTGMIPHHEGALEMAKLVAERSQNVEVKQLAATILRTQAAEITQYQTWLKTLK
jgi:uncharacterized protein (DUF305 family)